MRPPVRSRQPGPPPVWRKGRVRPGKRPLGAIDSLAGARRSHVRLGHQAPAGDRISQLTHPSPVHSREAFATCRRLVLAMMHRSDKAVAIIQATKAGELG
jgi:hypothetical protein